MEQFIDREYEMETLESEYRRKGSALVIMYGRRRVGKTTLISEFIKDKNALFFLASEESEAQNRALFKEKAADFIGATYSRTLCQELGRDIQSNYGQSIRPQTCDRYG